MDLKQSTDRILYLGPFLDETDGITPLTGLTIANTDINILKNGGTSFVNPTSGATHIGGGIYYFTITASNTDTLGGLEINCHPSGALPYQKRCHVFLANIYDSNFTNTVLQKVDLSGITSGAAAISKTASSFTLTTGSVASGTYLSTAALDGVYHVINDTAGTTDCYYETTIGGNASPVSTTINAAMQGVGDNIKVYGYNWTTLAWVQIGNIIGANSLLINQYTFQLTVQMVGTGADLGKVRIRFQNTGLGSSTLSVDRLLFNYSIVSQSVGYALGAIWVDTVDGTAGTEAFVNGVADKPCLTYADALTLASAIGLKKFQFISGSALTLPATTANKNFTLSGATLDLNGQEVNNCTFSKAIVSGIMTGGTGLIYFETCRFNNVTVVPGIFLSVALAGTTILGGAGDYLFDQCASNVAGSGTPVLDFDGVGVKTVNFRHYSGGIEIRNMKDGDKLSLEGWGQYRLHSSCTGGEMSVRGSFSKTDNCGGAISITDNANIQTTTITQGLVQAATANTITLNSTASSTSGAYDPAMVFIVSGTGAGQSRLILEYDGPTKKAIVDRDWKTTPDTTSEYRIIAHPGRQHVNEGMAQGGTASTIILNALASSQTDEYKGQLVFIRSGDGADQVRQITAYDGATKTATVTPDFTTTPTTASAYVMLPNAIYTTEEIAAAVWDDVATDIADAVEIETGAAVSKGKILRAIFNRLYRNVTQTATAQNVYNDSGVLIAAMTVSDDGTTQTKGGA